MLLIHTEIREQIDTQTYGTFCAPLTVHIDQGLIHYTEHMHKDKNNTLTMERCFQPDHQLLQSNHKNDQHINANIYVVVVCSKCTNFLLVCKFYHYIYTLLDQTANVGIIELNSDASKYVGRVIMQSVCMSKYITLKPCRRSIITGNEHMHTCKNYTCFQLYLNSLITPGYCIIGECFWLWLQKNWSLSQ